MTTLSAPMAIYAPNSTVDYKNNLDWKGALVAKKIDIKNNANIEYDSRVSDVSLGRRSSLLRGAGLQGVRDLSDNQRARLRLLTVTV